MSFKKYIKIITMLIIIVSTFNTTKAFTATRFELNREHILLNIDTLTGLSEIPTKLPKKKDSFIEKANLSQDPSGFRIRGINGWSWTPEQYLQEIPVLAEYKLNFLMNSYISNQAQPNTKKATTTKNEWWLPIPEARKRAYEKVFEKAREHGISFCFGINPQLSSSRPANLSSEKDFEAIWQHYAWAQSKGVRWFSLPLDDVTIKIDGKEHALFANKLLTRLRVKDKDAQMVFCPAYFDSNTPKEKAYLEELSKNLDKNVYVFWTIKAVLPGTITIADAEDFKKLVDHKLILCDNYPVNGAGKTLHLGPISGRDKNLYTVVDGYISNPLITQNEINRIPLFTMADYAYAPKAYEPSNSIGQAIIHQTEDQEQQQVLFELVKLYSSKLTSGITFNPILDHFKRITSPSSRSIAGAYLDYLKKVQLDLHREFPEQYKATKKTLSENIREIESIYHRNKSQRH